MGDFVSFFIVTIMLFIIISAPLFLHFVKHFKVYKNLKKEESKNLSEETEEEFAARITQEIIEKYSKKNTNKK